jgi:predicted kinase
MKTVIILRGLPGSGKSTVGELFESHYNVSMDHFWTKDGEEYAFDYSRLAEAIEWTQQRFLTFLRSGPPDLIIVDNVSYAKEHFQFFIDEAKKHDAVVHVVHVERPLDELNSLHDIPRGKVMVMAAKWEPYK